MPLSPAWGFLAVLLLADLVANGAGCLASRLTGSLAFSATAGMYRLLKSHFIDSSNVFCHGIFLLAAIELMLLHLFYTFLQG